MNSKRKYKSRGGRCPAVPELERLRQGVSRITAVRAPKRNRASNSSAHSVHNPPPACLAHSVHAPGFHTLCTHSRSHIVPLARGAHTLPACTRCAHTPACLAPSVHAPGFHTVRTSSRSHAVSLARGAHTPGSAPTVGSRRPALTGACKRLSRIRCTLLVLCARCRRSAAGDFL